MITIETGVPIPDKPRGREAKYPFPDMQAGDSFAIPINGSDPAAIRATVNRLNTAAHAWRRRNNPSAKFTLAVDLSANTVRIWRR